MIVLLTADSGVGQGEGFKVMLPSGCTTTSMPGKLAICFTVESCSGKGKSCQGQANCLALKDKHLAACDKVLITS
jgi:hypothetical protein